MSTPYRNDVDALNERKASLEGELARLQEQTSGLDELRSRQAQIAAELAQVDVRLAAGATRRKLPLLDSVRVASPCSANWDEMVGDENVRYCLSCEKNVYNLSSMRADDAEALLQSRLGGEVCVRFYRRTDGTLLTQDCPVGVKKKRMKRFAFAVAGAGALAAAAYTALANSRCRMGDMQPVAGGAMYAAPQVDPTPIPTVSPTNTAPSMGAAPLGETPSRMHMGVTAPNPPPHAPHPKSDVVTGRK